MGNVKKLIESGYTAQEILEATSKFVTADQLKQGDVFRRNNGYGISTFVAMGSLKQNRTYSNEYDLFATVLVPGKQSTSKYNKYMSEVHVTFQKRGSKFTSKIEYLGKWDDLKDNYGGGDD